MRRAMPRCGPARWATPAPGANRSRPCRWPAPGTASGTGARAPARNPGSTTPPPASITVAAERGAPPDPRVPRDPPVPIAAIRDPSTYTGPSTGPAGVSTVPPRINRSTTEHARLLEQVPRLAVHELLDHGRVDRPHHEVLHQHLAGDDRGPDVAP